MWGSRTCSRWYNVHWRGYDEVTESSWESRSSLISTAPKVVQAYVLGWASGCDDVGRRWWRGGGDGGRRRERGRTCGRREDERCRCKSENILYNKTSVTRSGPNCVMTRPARSGSVSELDLLQGSKTGNIFYNSI
eukprot:SAG31_NODE_11085_length_1067_cov_10.551653_1_plen_135_part_00